MTAQEEKDSSASFSSDDMTSFATRMLLHPGNILLATGVPSVYTAYRRFHQSLDSSLPSAAGGRDLGAAVASRALGVATRGSYGVFAILGSLVFYASGCSTFPDAVSACQRWGQAGRETLTSSLGLEDDSTGYNHPDYQATKGMTEDEELDYLSKKYFSANSYEDDESVKK